MLIYNLHWNFSCPTVKFLVSLSKWATINPSGTNIQGSHTPWKSLKTAVSAGKSLNFVANFIQSKGTERSSVENCSCYGRTKKDTDSRLFVALNVVFETWEVCPWKCLKSPWMFCSKKGMNPEYFIQGMRIILLQWWTRMLRKMYVSMCTSKRTALESTGNYKYSSWITLLKSTGSFLHLTEWPRWCGRRGYCGTKILGMGEKMQILKNMSKIVGASCCRNSDKLWSSGSDQTCGPLAAWANVQIEDK